MGDNVAGNEGITEAVVTGIIAAQGHAEKPMSAEPYVEPDYGSLWSRRWRVTRAALVVAAVGSVLLLFLMGSLR